MCALFGKSKISKLSVVVASALLLPAVAQANSFVYQFNNVFSGSTPAGSTPWITAAFNDVVGSPGTVELKISAAGLTGSEFLGGLLLNLDPADNPGKLAFTYVSSSGGFSLPSISSGANKFKANVDGKFDISFSFSQKSTKTFTSGEWVVYDITSTSPSFTLNALDFNYLSQVACGPGSLLAAANIGNVPGKCGTGTSWVDPYQLTPVPEPTTLTFMGLFGLGGLGLAAFRRKNRQA